MPIPVALGLGSWLAGGGLTTLLTVVLTSFAVRMFIALGLTFVSYQGVTLLFDGLETFVNNSVAQLDSYILAMLEISGFLFTIEIILATMCGVISIVALTATKKIIFR